MTEQRSTTLDDTAQLAGGPLASDDHLVADPEFVATLQKRRLTTRATRVLLSLIILGLGFVLGAYVQEQRNPSTAAASGLPAGLEDLFAGGAPPADAGATGGALTGTVTLVDGNNVYITDAQGNVTKIVTTADTAIKVNKDGTLADLGPSKSVTVEGSQNADGTYSATSIEESTGLAFPSGGAGFPTGANGGGGPPGGGG
jgi:hypothetical protein